LGDRYARKAFAILACNVPTNSAIALDQNAKIIK
jgi:hypothetical protein